VNIHGRHERCQEGDACHGPGCRIHTGKTRRKMNWTRPKPNKHEAERASAAPKKGSR
jgi:hypothetical protein